MNVYILINFLCLLSLNKSKAGNVDKMSKTSKDAVTTKFLLFHAEDITELIQEYFTHSVINLYTANACNSQYVAKPGLGKHFQKLSDKRWEEGKDLMKKYFQRGGLMGNTSSFDDNFKFTGENLLEKSSVKGKDFYYNALKVLLQDSKALTMDHLEPLLKQSLGKNHDSKSFDGDWSYYFSHKLKEEAEITRDLVGHLSEYTRLSALNSGIADEIFDHDLLQH